MYLEFQKRETISKGKNNQKEEQKRRNCQKRMRYDRNGTKSTMEKRKTKTKIK